MRTTLTVDDDLLRRAKEDAVALGLSLSEVVNRAIRRGFEATVPTRSTTSTLVFGDPADRQVVDVARVVAELDDEFYERKLGRR